jgi:hypothetical protein
MLAQGYIQLNIYVPQELKEHIRDFLQKDKNTLARILQDTKEDTIALEKINDTKEDTIALEKINDIKKDSISSDDDILLDEKNLYYTGNFSSRLKMVSQDFKVIDQKHIPPEEDELKIARIFIENIKKILYNKKNINLTDGKLTQILGNLGYYTRNKKNKRIYPTGRGVNGMRKQLDEAYGGENLKREYGSP